MVIGAIKLAAQGVKFLGKSKNGISVFREVLKDGTVVTKSFKDGKLFKEISQSQARILEPGVNNGASYLQRGTYVKNHFTGEDLNITKAFHNDGTVYWNVAKIGEKARTLFLKGRKIIEEIVQKHQPGGYIQVTRRNGNPVHILANDYKMPNGKVVNGTFGKDAASIFGVKPQYYNIKLGDNYYSGNKNFSFINGHHS